MDENEHKRYYSGGIILSACQQRSTLQVCKRVVIFLCQYLRWSKFVSKSEQALVSNLCRKSPFSILHVNLNSTDFCHSAIESDVHICFAAPCDFLVVPRGQGAIGLGRPVKSCRPHQPITVRKSPHLFSTSILLRAPHALM